VARAGDLLHHAGGNVTIMMLFMITPLRGAAMLQSLRVLGGNASHLARPVSYSVWSIPNSASWVQRSHNIWRGTGASYAFSRLIFWRTFR